MNQRRMHNALADFHVKTDENGNKLCVNCGKIITDKKQRKYCNNKCYYEFFTKNDHGALRLKLIIKTNRTCQMCGKKPTKKDYYGNDCPDDSCLVLDHIMPIALGGEEFDENNCQILCTECNKEKTSKDLKFIAEQRKKQKDINR
jgi:5-methylcytosine-specific restriction endonuclease McrA